MAFRLHRVADASCGDGDSWAARRIADLSFGRRDVRPPAGLGRMVRGVGREALIGLGARACGRGREALPAGEGSDGLDGFAGMIDRQRGAGASVDSRIFDPPPVAMQLAAS